MTLSYPIAAVIGGDVYATGSPSIPLVSAESCTDSGDHTTYQAASHEFWDWTQVLTVQNSPNGSTSWVTVTDYTFQYATGKIIFNTARTVGVNNFVQISVGNYFTATQYGNSYMWMNTVECKVEDTTTFQSPGGWQLNTPLIKSAKAEIDTYQVDNRMFAELGNMVGLKLYIDKLNNIRWQFFATPLAPKTTAQVAKVETQKITFVSVHDVYFAMS
jgi:hypothetical protein